MNIPRSCVFVDILLFLLLFAAQTASGQNPGFSVTISPPNLVTSEPITFYFQTVPNSYNFVRVTSSDTILYPVRPLTCPPANSNDPLPVPQDTILYENTPPYGNQADSTGALTTSVTNGLPAGSYALIINSLAGPGSSKSYGTWCWAFTVQPAIPSITISPSNPIAGQPITISGTATPGDEVVVDIYPGASCASPYEETLSFTPFANEVTGAYIVFVPAGLSAGSWNVWAGWSDASGSNSGEAPCQTFTVSPRTGTSTTSTPSNPVYSATITGETPTTIVYNTKVVSTAAPPSTSLSTGSSSIVDLLVTFLVIAIASLAIIAIRRRTKSKKLQTETVSQGGTELLKSIEPKVVKESTKLKFCRECGAQIPGDSLFCEECGTKLKR